MRLEEAIEKIDNLKIGNTSLLELHPNNQHARIYAKCEWENQFGSIKDRVAFAMIKDMLLQHPELLDPNKELSIIEYSGGNLALAIAEICFQINVSVHLVLPESISPALLSELRRLNACIHLSKAEEGFYGVIQLAKRLARGNKQFKLLYQHKNINNLLYHQEHTAQETRQQLINIPEEAIQAFGASIGTGASLIGTYLGLKRYYPNLKLFATSPKEMPYGTLQKPHSRKKFAGSGGIGFGLKQPFVSPYEKEIVNHFLVSLDECYQEMINFYHEHGIAIGTSSAANLLAAKKMAAQFNNKQAVVTIFPSKATSAECKELGLL